jgi:hypothetical protein
MRIAPVKMIPPNPHTMDQIAGLRNFIRRQLIAV